MCLVFLRYVFGYQKRSNIQAKGFRSSGQKVTHVVSSTMMIGLLRSLLRDRFGEEPSKEETEIQVKKVSYSPGDFSGFPACSHEQHSCF